MDHRELTEKAEDFIAQNEQAIVQDIAALVAIPSVEGPPEPGAPFGRQARHALDTALGMARRMGLATEDGDGFVGWAALPGREEGHLATITHLDVVPEGAGWTGEPYVLRQQDGWLIGRGVADDKGPAVLTLYAAKFFKELGLPLRYGLRVLLGCNEESGMADLPHYFEHNPQPLFCFSPDAAFPVCNGEKGTFGGWFSSGVLADGRLLAFEVGLAPNVIPERASCLVAANPAALQSTDRVHVVDEGGNARLEAQGIGGHAAKPEGTLNAVGLLVDYLLQHQLCTGAEADFLELMRQLCEPSGKRLGIDCRDEVFDALTVNAGMVRLEGGRLRTSVDIRFPTATNGAALLKALTERAAKYGASFEGTRAGEPFYIPPDAPAIQVLLNTYNEVSGREERPFTMGGGTYARHFAHAVSYGPEENDVHLPAFVGPEHGPNEGAYLPSLLKALKIYILALWRLQALDFTP